MGMAQKLIAELFVAALFLIGSASCQCQILWGQCAGMTYKGPTCCPSGSFCRYQDSYYSQCVPNSSSATTLATSTRTSQNSQNCQTSWQQCDGLYFTGAKCCESGYWCWKKDDYYSQCIPNSSSPTPVSTSASRITAATTRTTTVTARTTTRSTTATTAKPVTGFTTTRSSTATPRPSTPHTTTTRAITTIIPTTTSRTTVRTTIRTASPLTSTTTVAGRSTGFITTWQGDPTGSTCSGYQQCDSGSMLCSAPMKPCTCQSGIERPANETNSSNRFFWWCNQGNIDGKLVTEADRAKCRTCRLPTCDQWDHPVCSVNCGNPICVAGIQTYEMDTCPSNHQKNVAKCCMWGGSYCACVASGNWMDVNGAVMNLLQCKGLCGNGTWNQGQCSGTYPKPNPVGSLATCNDSCTNEPPPDASQYSCAQQAAWGKCSESWMQGFCCKSCANAAKCGSAQCVDVPPPDSAYSCAQQKQWGKCGESWMQGYCMQTCGRC